MPATYLPDKYYRAIQDPIEGWKTTGQYSDTENIKVVWHKTVGGNYPRSTYVRGGGIPHFTIARNLFECCCADDHRPSERSSAYLIDSNNRVRTKEEIPIFGTEDVDSRCHNCD